MAYDLGRAAAPEQLYRNSLPIPGILPRGMRTTQARRGRALLWAEREKDPALRKHGQGRRNRPSGDGTTHCKQRVGLHHRAEKRGGHPSREDQRDKARAGREQSRAPSAVSGTKQGDLLYNNLRADGGGAVLPNGASLGGPTK